MQHLRLGVVTGVRFYLCFGAYSDDKGHHAAGVLLMVIMSVISAASSSPHDFALLFFAFYLVPYGNHGGHARYLFESLREARWPTAVGMWMLDDGWGLMGHGSWLDG